MTAKAQTEELLPPCSVCGGNLRGSGECAVCGTKNDLRRPPASTASASKGPGPGTPPRAPRGAAPVSVAAAPPPGGSDPGIDVLRKWLTGEEGAFERWLGVAKSEDTTAGASDAVRRLREKDRILQTKETALRTQSLELAAARAELDALKRNLLKGLDGLKSGDFNPIKYMEDLGTVSRDLATETAKRKELEEEIQKIKKGSVAIIRYMKSQQAEPAGAVEAVRKELAEAEAARTRVEAELAQSKQLATELRKQVEKGFASAKPETKALKERELALLDRESALKAREAAVESAEKSRAASGPASEEARGAMEAELREREAEYRRKEHELAGQIAALKADLDKARIEAKLRDDSARLAGKSKPEVDALLVKKETELQAKEKSILLREAEIDRLKSEAAMKEEEMKRLKEPLTYKEDELSRREEDLLYREKMIQSQLRKMEEAKQLGGSVQELELRGRLEQLKADISRKEDEVRAKEKYLATKMEELRLREQGMVEEEIQAREAERQLEVAQEKVRTGTSRLDDLLLGGIPFGSNISIYGPPFVGKEVIVLCFLAEGLKKGLPILWVLTDKMPGDIREEMKFVLPSYEEYEKMGLVRYVDAYSKSMGAATNDPNAVYVDDLTDFASIAKQVDAISSEFRKKYSNYRLGFRSVSTLIAYLDPTTTFKFLQPFSGRRKRDKAVSMYIIEKGMHEEKEIEMLGSVMDGSIEFKVEQLKSFLSIKGISDVQSRAWIRYTHSKSGVSIGSFSLDHIK